MFCRNCGNKLGEEARFCGRCGTSVVWVTAPVKQEPFMENVAEQPKEIATQVKEEQPQKVKTPPVVHVMIAIAAMILLVTAGAFFLLYGGDETKEISCDLIQK